MINETPRESNFSPLTEPISSSDLSFQFDFEDNVLLFATENTKSSFVDHLRDKWMDHRGELGIVVLAYLLISLVIAILGTDLFPNNQSPSTAKLALAPIQEVTTFYKPPSKEEVSFISQEPEVTVEKEDPKPEEKEELIESSSLISEKQKEATIESTNVEPTKTQPEEDSNYHEPSSEIQVVNKGHVQIISAEYHEMMQQVNVENKYALLKFGAKWCVPCRLMEETVFQDEQVNLYLDQYFRTLKVDIDEFDGINLKQHFKVNRIPAFVILDSQGAIVERFEKSFSTSEMLELLERYSLNESTVLQESNLNLYSK